MTIKWLNKLPAPALATALMASPAVWAGSTEGDAVAVNILNDVASGPLAIADTRQSIGCSIFTRRDKTGQVTPMVSCSATNASGTTLSCTSSTSDLILVGRLLHNRGWLRFVVDPAASSTEPHSGSCRELGVGFSSTARPAQLNQLP